MLQTLLRNLTRDQGREIGPIGTLARVVGGTVAIAVPIALSGIGWWDVGVALIALPLITGLLTPLVIGGFERFAPRSLARRNAICSAPACVLVGGVVAVGIALTFVTPANGGVAIWTFLGASMLVAAVRGYAGCEVLAIPNAVTGRGDEVGCMLYTPIDRAEASRSRESRSRAAQAHG